jgi:hypothetical protein
MRSLRDRAIECAPNSALTTAPVRVMQASLLRQKFKCLTTTTIPVRSPPLPRKRPLRR